MKIKIIFVGKTKEGYLREGIEDYLKRLRGYFDVEIIEFKEATISKTFERRDVLKAEGEKILEKMDGMFSVILDEYGKNFDSVKFSEIISDKKDFGMPILFVIGGAFGISDEVKKRADLSLSLSKMTFTHEMARLILLEQIYRAACIISGKEYHIQ